MKTGSINVNGKSFYVWMNPERGEFAQIGESVRFNMERSKAGKTPRQTPSHYMRV
jgi:hypothetical protein